MKSVDNKSVLSLLKALGNPIRLDIINCLIPGESCVCRIFEQLELPQNLVSHHLAVLREIGLITARKEGKWVLYSLNRSCFVQLKNLFESFSLAKNKKFKC
ncbi:transcriptional regulator [bacterium]|nr:transcriptional regulator [bacterium]